MRKRQWWTGIWNLEMLKPDGTKLWEHEQENSVNQACEQMLLDTFFRNNATTTAPNPFYLRFCLGGLPLNATFANVSGEPSGNGYVASPLTRDAIGFPTLQLIDNHWWVVSATISMTASGGSIGPVDTMFLASSSDNSGVILASLTLPVARVVLSGDTLRARGRIRLG